MPSILKNKKSYDLLRRPEASLMRFQRQPQNAYLKVSLASRSLSWPQITQGERLANLQMPAQHTAHFPKSTSPHAPSTYLRIEKRCRVKGEFVTKFITLKGSLVSARQTVARYKLGPGFWLFGRHRQAEGTRDSLFLKTVGREQVSSAIDNRWPADRKQTAKIAEQASHLWIHPVSLDN